MWVGKITRPCYYCREAGANRVALDYGAYNFSYWLCDRHYKLYNDYRLKKSRYNLFESEVY